MSTSGEMDSIDTSFSVFFSGQTRLSFSEELASKNFMNAFKVSPEAMDALHARAKKAPVLLKKNLDAVTAKRLAQKVEDCGFVCKHKIDEMKIVDDEKTVFEKMDAAERHKQNKTIENWVTCAECFKRQDADNERCEDCTSKLKTS